MNLPESPSPRSDSAAARLAAVGPPPEVPDYALVRCIGVGSYGEVWLARSAVGGWVAVKVVRREKFDHEAHYEREFIGVSAYAPLSVKEPELLRVLHVGRNENAGFFYYAMELADAVGDATAAIDPERYVPRTLKEEQATRGRLPLAECLKLGKELATALGCLHHNGLLHRDVKPSNVVYVRGEAKLADIGLVTNYDRTLSLQSGTMGYSPPEGIRTPDGDLYALGKLLYVVGTGEDRMQFPKLPDLGGLDRKVAREIRELNPVLLKACENEPKRRYQTAAKLVADLEYMEEGSSLRRLRNLKKALKVAAVVFALGLVGGAFWHTERQRQLEQNHRRASGLLRNVELARLGSREVGWAGHHWSTLKTAAVIRTDKDLFDQAAATLAGLDAKPTKTMLTNGGSSVLFAPDGRLLAGGLFNEPARVIDMNQVVTLARSNSPGPVCLDTNGTPLHVVMESLRRIVLRELATGIERRSFTTDGDLLRSGSEPVIAISPTGTILAAALDAGGVVRWEIGGTDRTHKLGRPREYVTALAFSPDGALLAVGRQDGQVTMHDSRSLELVSSAVSATRKAVVTSLAFGRDYLVPEAGADPSRAWLLGIGNSGAQILVWDIARGELRATLRGSQNGISALAFSPDGTTLASGGRYAVRLWDVATEKLLLVIPPAPVNVDRARGLAFAANTAGRLYDLQTRQVIQRWKLPQGLSDTLAYDAQGRLVLLRSDASSRRRRWSLLELKADGTVSELHGQLEDNWVAYAMRMTADGTLGAVVGITRHAATGERNYFMTVIDLQTGREKWTRRANFGENVPILATAGQWMALATDGNEYQVVSLTDGKDYGRIAGLRALTASRNHFVRSEPAGGRGGTILFHKPDANDEGIALGIDWRNGELPAFSRDERFLAWGTAEGTVLVADIEEVMRRLKLLSRVSE